LVILLLLIIYLAFISLGLPDSLFGVAWPLMHIDLGLDISFAPVISIIIAVCTAGVSFVAGPIIRKLGTKWVVAGSVLLTAIGMLGMSYANHVALVVFCGVLLGIGAGVIDAALNDYVSKYYGARHMSWLHGFWGVGVTISPLVMSVFLEKGGWRGGYAAMSYIQFGLTAVMFIAIPLWDKVQKIKEGEKVENLVNEELKDNKTDVPMVDVEVESLDNKTVEPILDVEVGPLDKKKKQKVNIFTEKGVIFSAIAFALYCGVEYSCGLWGASFLVQRHAFTPALAARYIALYYGGLMVGRFLCGAIVGKLKSQMIIRIGLVVAIVGTILLALPVPEIMLPGMLLIGFGLAPFFPTSLDLTKTRFNPAYSPDIIGFQMGSAYAGAFIIQTLVGVISSKVSWTIYPILLIAVSAGILGAFEMVNIRSKSK
jgi:fucose permease